MRNMLPNGLVQPWILLHNRPADRCHVPSLTLEILLILTVIVTFCFVIFVFFTAPIGAINTLRRFLMTFQHKKTVPRFGISTATCMYRYVTASLSILLQFPMNFVCIFTVLSVSVSGSHIPFPRSVDKTFTSQNITVT